MHEGTSAYGEELGQDTDWIRTCTGKLKPVGDFDFEELGTEGRDSTSGVDWIHQERREQEQKQEQNRKMA
jgi:hypothetical protein